MNNSSVIFVGGFTIVFGFFAAQSFNADARTLRTADARASQLQADLIASSGINIAAYWMATPSSSDGISVSDKVVNGGTLDYTITYDSGTDPNTAWVVSVGTLGEISVTKRATLTRGVTTGGWYQWSIAKIYTDPYSLSDVLID